jgi:hypothetical protein
MRSPVAIPGPSSHAGYGSASGVALAVPGTPTPVFALPVASKQAGNSGGIVNRFTYDEDAYASHSGSDGDGELDDASLRGALFKRKDFLETEDEGASRRQHVTQTAITHICNLQLSYTRSASTTSGGWWTWTSS